jgi:hypothetical protein
VSEPFLHPIKSAFVDFLVEARKLERLNDSTVERFLLSLSSPDAFIPLCYLLQRHIDTPKAEIQALFNHHQQRSTTHSVHYADGNQTKVEVAVNEQFLHPIESAFAATAFVDFLVEDRKFERLNDHGPIFEIANLDFPFP